MNVNKCFNDLPQCLQNEMQVLFNEDVQCTSSYNDIKHFIFFKSVKNILEDCIFMYQ